MSENTRQQVRELLKKKIREARKPFRALPANLTIGDSNIHGLGIFAKEDIPEGDLLGLTHVWYPGCGDWIRTPLGGFYNHFDDPNCETIVKRPIEGVIERYIYAGRNIAAGEEITVFYNLYDKDADME